jgi:hypothetical protein
MGHARLYVCRGVNRVHGWVCVGSTEIRVLTAYARKRGGLMRAAILVGAEVQPCSNYLLRPISCGWLLAYSGPQVLAVYQ